MKAFLRDIERFAMPFFDALRSVEQIADFFERKKTFAKPRANWELTREKVAGPSERFWREDRGLLLEVAMRALAAPSSLDASVAEAKRRAAVWTKRDIYGGSPQLEGFIAALAEAIREDGTASSTKATTTTKTAKALSKPKTPKPRAAKRRG